MSQNYRPFLSEPILLCLKGESILMKFSLQQLLTVCFFLWISCLGGQAEEWQGEKSSFHDFEQYDFPLDELKCKVVIPAHPAEGTPWAVSYTHLTLPTKA